MKDAKGAWDLGKDESVSIWLLYTVLECMELETTVQIPLVAHTCGHLHGYTWTHIALFCRSSVFV